MKKLILLAAIVALTGCTTVADRSWKRCELIRIAFDEQDQLAPGWFDAALIELQACGMSHYSTDAAKDRGKS